VKSNGSLVAAYATAFTEWDESDDAVLWDRTSADGIDAV